MLTSLLPTVFAVGAAALSIPNQHEPRAAATVYSHCVVPGTIALTFDNGPFMYTDQLIDILNAAGVKATFFVNGQNFASIYDYASTIKRMVNSGHQVASNTWDHPHLTGLNEEGIRTEMLRLEEALHQIIGRVPTFMRPPYGEYNDLVLQTVGDMGYKVINWDVDLGDDQGISPEQSQAKIDEAISQGANNYLVRARDTSQETVEVVIPHVIKTIQSHGLLPVTVGECLGLEGLLWYKVLS